MDNFDKTIRQHAKQEKFNVPNKYNERIDILLENINTNAKKTKKRTSMKVLLAAAVLTMLTTVSVFAAPIISDMAGGVISYFDTSDDFKYLSQKAIFEKFNSKVGMSVENNGVKLTIDNIAVDDNYINVFYTINSKSPIKLKGAGAIPNNWSIRRVAPVFSFKADGKYIDPPTNIDIDSKLVNENTLSGMQRFSLTKELSDKFNLEIYTDNIADIKGTWYIPLIVDKAIPKSDTLTVTPDIKATVTSGINPKYTHEISIDKLSISPFGSKIDITENAKSNNIFDKFILISDNGKYLNVIELDRIWENHVKSSSTQNSKVFTSFEFMGGTADMKNIKLLPFSLGTDNDGTPAPQLILKSISDKLPIRFEQSRNGTIVIDEIKITKDSAKITLHTEGVVYSPSIALLDEKGEHLKMDFFKDKTYDRQTSQTTLTYRFNGASDKEIAKIKKLGIYTQTIVLNEAEAITIPLQ